MFKILMRMYRCGYSNWYWEYSGYPVIENVVILVRTTTRNLSLTHQPTYINLNFWYSWFPTNWEGVGGSIGTRQAKKKYYYLAWYQVVVE